MFVDFSVCLMELVLVYVAVVVVVVVVAFFEHFLFICVEH